MTTISLNPSNGIGAITGIDFGSSSPKLRGTVDITAYVSASSITCSGNGISSISMYTGIDNVISTISINRNRFTSYPDISNYKKLTTITCIDNEFPIYSQNLPAITQCPLLISYYISNNSSGGSMPLFSGSTVLTTINISGCSLTGNITDLSHCSGSILSLSLNNNFLSGTIPSSFSNCTKLFNTSLNNNQLTGNIPDISNLNVLSSLSVYSNRFTTYLGSFPASLKSITLNNNLFTQTSVDNILLSAVSAGAVSGSLNIGGTGNSTPSSTGLTYVSTLINRHWSVTTN